MYLYSYNLYSYVNQAFVVQDLRLFQIKRTDQRIELTNQLTN